MSRKIDLKKIIKNNAKSLDQRVKRHETFRKSAKLATVVILTFIFISYSFIFGLALPYVDSREAALYLLSVSAILVILGDVLVHARKIPSRVDIEKYYWTVEKQSTFVRLIGYGLVLFLAYSFDLNSRAIFFSWSIVVFYLIFSLVVLYIRKNPIRLKDKLITGFGSAAFDISFIAFILFGFSKWIDFEWKVLLVFIGAIGVLIWRSYYHRHNRLDVVQLIAIKTISPKILLHELKPEWKRISNRVEALKLLKKLDKNGKYGVRQELAKELIAETSSQKGLLISFLLALGLYFITSIGEGLIQDLFNDDIKEFLCRLVKIYCK